MPNIYMRYPGGRLKAFTMSYDDGVQTDARLIAIMQKNGLKGTFNLNSGLFAPDGTVYAPGTIHRRMTADDVLATYADSGMEIAAHGYAHPFLESLPDSAMMAQITRDKEALERMFGRIIRGFVLPFGTANKNVTDALRLCGFAYCRACCKANNGYYLPENWIPFTPTTHHSDPELDHMLDTFFEMKTAVPRLFYLWGHSYEFEYNKGANSWQAIEAVCEKVGGHEDVWYATNIEIVDYLAAYRRLETSFDGTILHNPTALPLCLDAGGTPITIRPGETLHL